MITDWHFHISSERARINQNLKLKEITMTPGLSPPQSLYLFKRNKLLQFHRIHSQPKIQFPTFHRFRISKAQMDFVLTKIYKSYFLICLWEGEYHTHTPIPIGKASWLCYCAMLTKSKKTVFYIMFIKYGRTMCRVINL